MMQTLHNDFRGFGSFHGPSCECCSREGFMSGKAKTVRYETKSQNHGYKISPHFNPNTIGNLGDPFSDIFEALFGGITDITNGILNIIGSILETIKNALESIYAGIEKAFKSIDWDAVAKTLGELAGNAMIYMNITHLSTLFFKSFPLTSHLFDELDKLSGGALTTIDNLNTITGRALRGDAISKQECVTNALFLLRVGAVMMAGPAGSAAMNAVLVAQVAGQLKQGTLGKTELGRTLLGVAEVAGYAYFAGSVIQDAIVQKGIGEGQSYVLTKTPLGKGSLGPYLAGLAFAAAGTAYAGGSQWDTMTSFSKDYARGTAISETAQRVGGPYAKEIATATVDAVKDGQFDPSKIGFDKVPSGYSFDQFLTDMQNAYGDVKESIVDYMNSSGGQMQFPEFDFSGAGAALVEVGTNVLNEIKRVPDNVMDLADSVSMPSVESPSFPDLSVPDVASPSFDFSLPVVDWDSLYGAIEFIGKKALYRRRDVAGKNGGKYTVYVLEDGSLYYEKQDNSGFMSMLLLAGAAAVVATA